MNMNKLDLQIDLHDWFSFRKLLCRLKTSLKYQLLSPVILPYFIFHSRVVTGYVKAEFTNTERLTYVRKEVSLNIPPVVLWPLL